MSATDGGVWDDFASETTTHGIGRVVSGKRRCGARLFWAAIFLFGTAFFTFQARKLITKYYGYPKNVETSLHFAALPFPAITICNQNPIRSVEQLKDTPLGTFQRGFTALLRYFTSRDNVDATSMKILKKICKSSPLLCVGIDFGATAEEFGWLVDADGNIVDYDDYFGNPFEDMGSGESSGEESSGSYDDYDNGAMDRRKRETNRDGQNATVDGQNATVSTRLSIMQLTAKAASDMKYIIMEAKRTNMTEYMLYQSAMTDINSFVKDCSIHLKQCDLEKQFTAVDSTQFGRCFTFNPIDPRTNETIKILRAGATFGLRMVIFVDQLMSMATTDTAGVKIVVHNPGEHPFPETVGYSAQVNMRTAVGLQMLQTKRLSSPYGDCIENKDENSHLEDDGGPDYFFPGRYTIQGCTFTCIAKFIALQCNCTPPTYPEASRSFTVKTFDENENEKSVKMAPAELCTLKEKRCADLEENDLLTSANTEEDMDACGCFPACHETSYVATLSISSIAETSTRNEQTIPCNETKAGAALWMDPWNDEGGDNYGGFDYGSYDEGQENTEYYDNDYNNNNGDDNGQTGNNEDYNNYGNGQSFGGDEGTCTVDRGWEQAEIEVFYEQLSYRLFEEVESYSSVQLISDLGGQLGLWLGMSILSLAELLSLVLSLLGGLCHLTSGDIEKKSSSIAPEKKIRYSKAGSNLGMVPLPVS